MGVKIKFKMVWGTRPPSRGSAVQGCGTRCSRNKSIQTLDFGSTFWILGFVLWILDFVLSGSLFLNSLVIFKQTKTRAVSETYFDISMPEMWSLPFVMTDGKVSKHVLMTHYDSLDIKLMNFTIAEVSWTMPRTSGEGNKWKFEQVHL